MSHKEKLCQPALASHIEVCHEQCNFTPLIIKRKDWLRPVEKPGLRPLIESELDQQVDKEAKNLIANTQKEVERIKKRLGDALVKQELPISTTELKSTTVAAFEEEVNRQLDKAIDDSRTRIIEESDGRLNASNPEVAIDLREEPIREKLYDLAQEEAKPVQISQFSYELENLGLFFKESICHRAEGITYSPCGKEITILPGEEIKESNVLKTTLSQTDSTAVETSENITSTDRDEFTESFSTSYEKTVKKETDIKLATEASFKLGLPFKLLKIDLGTSASYGFNKLITEINKSSHSTTQKRFNEVVRKLATSSNASSTSTVTGSKEIAFNRTWKNETDKPITYIKRKSYCKTSVIHKRHNVQLAWSGCIDNPAEGLCTPDNIEEKCALDIQKIRDKWNLMAAPEFGPEPKDTKVVTAIHTRRRNLAGVWYRVSISHTIPSGWFYVGGSADAHVDASGVQGDDVEAQPAHGATGTVTFTSRVDTKSTNKPIYTKFSFTIRSSNAQVWHDRVQFWRDGKAQEEIDALIAKKTEELNKFLASDQAKAAIERRIFEDFFGVGQIEDCCRLIARIKRIFDFDAMCYSLLPSWNKQGEGCQRNFPVNLYTAKCLHFYLPVREGLELKALSILISINAIPWNSQIAVQVIRYIQAINTMRATLYKPAFDPTGWDVKFDQPKGYDMTPYDTANPDWSAAHESNLNYELLGAFTINVPLGERLDCRPPLCC